MTSQSKRLDCDLFYNHKQTMIYIYSTLLLWVIINYGLIAYLLYKREITLGYVDIPEMILTLSFVTIPYLFTGLYIHMNREIISDEKKPKVNMVKRKTKRKKRNK